MFTSKIVTILFTIFSKCSGDLSSLIGFLPDINLIQLHQINSSTISFSMNNESDEIIYTFVEQIEKHVKPIYFEDRNNILNSELCEVPTLIVLPIDSQWLQQNGSCDVKGRFIYNPCQTMLIFANYKVEFDPNLYHWMKCNLVHQPIVFVWMRSNKTSYELFEVQLTTERIVKLITWIEDEPPR